MNKMAQLYQQMLIKLKLKLNDNISYKIRLNSENPVELIQLITEV